MAVKIIMVTGANSGIGRQTTMALARKGHQVVMVCRNAEKGRAVRDDINAKVGLRNVDLLIADLSHPLSIKQMAEEFKKKYSKLDVLINNAGAMLKELQKTEDGLEYMMAVNHFGYFITTHYLMDALRQSDQARIINVASEAHRFARLNWDNMNAEKSFKTFRQYALTKLCNILFTNKLAKVLEQERIYAFSLHPGVVASNFWSNTTPAFIQNIGNKLMISPVKGAETSVYLAISKDLEAYNGGYFKKKKKSFPSALALNTEEADKLWAWSLKHAGIQEFGEVE